MAYRRSGSVICGRWVVREKRNMSDNDDDDSWYSEDLVREHNPDLDEIQGHRAFVPPGDYDVPSWDTLVDVMVRGRRRGGGPGGKRKGGRKRPRPADNRTLGDNTMVASGRSEGDDQTKDGLSTDTGKASSAPSPVSKVVVPVPFRRRRGASRARPERMQLCTTDFRPSFVSRAIFAGLFPFASEVEHFPGKPLEERCLLNLELGGAGRERDASRVNDCGGRVVLVAEEPSVSAGAATVNDRETSPSPPVLPLHVGKKTIRALRAGGPGSLAIRLTTDTTAVLESLVKTHGVDWIGFRRVRQLLGAPPSAWEGREAKLVSIELCRRDAKGGSNDRAGVLISGEIGFICGSCYTCLSLFSSDDKMTGQPRSGRIRAEGAALLLVKIGVRLIDVGTSADYFRQFGFKKRTRREFVELWRRSRCVPLSGFVKDNLEMSGKELMSRMEAQRSTMTARSAV